MRRQNHYEARSKQISGDDLDENEDSRSRKAYESHNPAVSYADALYDSSPSSTDFTSQPTIPAFTFHAPAPVTEPARNPFAFQQRARESAAASQVSSRISSNRDTRKAGFIDRLRRSRRDERDARGLDSFEKAEYWRERREREVRFRREAAGYGIDAGEDLLDTDVYDDEEAELSPVDDEREVADLVDAYYDRNVLLERTVDDELMSDDFGIDDEEDYAEAFLEVLSQEQKGIDSAVVCTALRHYDVGGIIAADDVQEGDMDIS